MRVAVVVPRYGPGLVGGAENQARGFAEAAVRRGWSVEVWTTCARSHYTWENDQPPGLCRVGGVPVRRFPVVWGDRARWARLQGRLDLGLALDGREAYEWLEAGPHSPGLYAHVARYASDRDAVVALPYTFPLTHYAGWAAPERVVVWPCLHDEPHAYLEPVRLLLEGVWGVMFNSPEEAGLAARLGIRPARFAVLGEGVELAREGLTGSKGPSGPFILYAGRLEDGKNVALLYEYVRRHFEAGGGVRLVVVGDGPVRPPVHPAFVDLGFVDEATKAALFRQALALCQPSLRESFSLTVMEAWLAGRPVLVHEDCAVTCGHVRRSRGGLWFRTYEDFAGALDWLLARPELAARMGANGRRYVLSNYTWELILGRFERLIRCWRAR